VLDNVTGQPKPGYWDISYMVKNQTWNDVLAQAKANNWNWINSNTNEWNWLWFGTDQNYNVNVLSSGGTSTSGVDLKYEFAGLSLFNDSQQTHYFMPKTVGNITFLTPGQSFGNFNDNGSMVVPLNATINFGVTFDNVNGTLFPYNDQRSMWGWWDRPIYGSDFNSPNFMNQPTTSSIDQLAFAVHFAGNQTSDVSQYNSASMKIDQHVGNWNLPPDTVDGRQENSSGVMVPLVGNNVLSNRSLAINYYATASTSMGWNVKDDHGANVNNNNVTESSLFNIESQASNVNFASIKLGSTYDWGKPTTATDQIRTFNVTSQTTALQNFQSSYQSYAGKSSTGFDISSSMYFLTQSFPQWGGYSINNDPQVSVLLSKGTDQISQPNPQPSPQPSNSPPNNSQPTSNPSSSSPGTPKFPTSATPNPIQNPPPKTSTPTPQEQTSPPTQSPNTQMPITLIGLAVAVVLGIVIAAFMVMRTKKKRKPN
jgi:hypothetical protein